MKYKAELKMDTALYELLKIIPGGSNYFFSNGGHIRQKTPPPLTIRQ